MRKTYVKMTKKSKLDQTNDFTNTYVGDVVMNKDFLILDYMEDVITHCKVEYKEDTVLIKREAQLTTELLLDENKETLNTILTPFGEMVIKIRTKSIDKGDNYLAVEYLLMQDEQMMDEIRIIWEIDYKKIS